MMLSPLLSRERAAYEPTTPHAIRSPEAPEGWLL